MTNALQILLSQSGWMLYGSCLLLVVVCLQAFRLSALALRFLLQVSVLHKRRTWFVAALTALLLFPFAGRLVSGLQWIEDHYTHPVYYGANIPAAELQRKYENEIRRHVSPSEFDTIQAWTARTAARINSTPIAIYETAWLECGFKPFNIRADGVAAGWIQFTKAGCAGLGVTLDQVKDACRRRDIGFIMRLTDEYLYRRWVIAGRPDMRNTIDLYLAVFAPAHIGKQPDQVVYAGFNNPAYYKNSGLDGWYLDGGKICRGFKDGRIQVFEIFLCLERKKGLIL